VSFTDSIRTCFSKFATFDGRATRSEFWWFYLFAALVALAGYIPILILMLIGAAAGDDGGAVSGIFAVITVILWIVYIIFVIALYIPLLAVGSRRLHDRGQSGWLQLLLLVPCGNIVLIVFWVMEGTPGDNMYGPKPVA
jgi:uncharacterized membrane protein YhaH (DUF805 family)